MAKPAEKLVTKDLVETPNVNHLEKATRQHQTIKPTHHLREGVDGNRKYSMGNGIDVVKPTINLSLKKTTLIKHVEVTIGIVVFVSKMIKHIKSWNLYLCTRSRRSQWIRSGKWKLAHQRTGTPV